MCRSLRVGAAALVMVLAGCGGGRTEEAPTDAAMQARFKGIRPSLEALVALDFASAAHMDSVGGAQNVDYRDPAFRREQDRRTALLYSAGLRGGETVSFSDSTVHIPLWHDRDEVKGFAYSARTPRHLESSLDTPPPPARSTAEIVIYHRQIEGRWYLYRHRNTLQGD